MVNALFLLWVIAGISDRASKDCPPGDDLCVAASDAGTGIGVALIIVLWFFVFIVVSLIWLMTRPSRRICPACGESVKKGVSACKTCGHNFAVAASAVPSMSAPSGEG
ncbi:MAG: hypothetical protein ACKVUT_07300 [Gaiella sp.]